jgi:adenylate cyclase
LERRLAAILAADVVDYSRLMGEDQGRTLAALRQLRNELFGPIVAEHKGTIVKSMGDGWIVEFPSISDGVACAIRIQDGLSEHEIIHLRIGIHTGEVTFEADDVFGDGVNVAARLESLAPPGQILISDNAYQSLDGKTGSLFSGGQTRKLKNISRAVGVWYWSAGPDPEDSGIETEAGQLLPLPNKPSIAVLPFDNMSSDQEQEYFADGITEDIITELSKFQWLMVIARNSSFTFKNQSVDIRDVGQALGVRYVLEGSIRRSGNRVRITGQLIDATDGSHIWADKIDGVLDDIFELQDQITLDVIGAIEPTLRQAETNRLRAKPTEDMEAYELYLRAQSHFHLVSDDDNRAAIKLLSQAVTLDPGYAIASGLLAWCFVQRLVQNWDVSEVEIKQSIKLAEQVLESERADAMALAYAAHVTTMFTGGSSRARKAFERSLSENPNSALAHALFSGNLNSLSEPEDGLSHAEQALRLSPRDTFRYSFNLMKAVSLLFLERYEDATEAAKAAISDRHNFLLSWYVLIAALVLKGDIDMAVEARNDLYKISPDVTVEAIANVAPFFRTDAAEKYRWALREAGIPE